MSTASIINLCFIIAIITFIEFIVMAVKSKQYKHKSQAKFSKSYIMMTAWFLLCGFAIIITIAFATGGYRIHPNEYKSTTIATTTNYTISDKVYDINNHKYNSDKGNIFVTTNYAQNNKPMHVTVAQHVYNQRNDNWFSKLNPATLLLHKQKFYTVTVYK